MSKVLKTLLFVICLSFFSFALVSCSEKDISQKEVKSKDVESIDLIFSKFWPFPKGMIQYTLSEDRKTMVIKGNHIKTFGLSSPKTLSLKGKNMLEIEVVDMGNSIFREDETNKESGDGKMLKVFVDKDNSGEDFTLICDNNMIHSNDPEFIIKGKGKFLYKLDNIGTIYKLGFAFYNAKLSGFKVRARLIYK